MRRLTSLWLFDWRKVAVYTHRWLGIAGCVFFAAWFLSGIVMMYARMPELANQERLARAPALDLSTVTISPAEAAARHGIRADAVRVGMYGTRPVYRYVAGGASGGDGHEPIVYADTGTLFMGLSREGAEQVARRWVSPAAPPAAPLTDPLAVPRGAAPLTYDGVLTEPDQWTLQARALMPMYRFALDDPAGTRLYVSTVTGDVVLRTTRRERFWGYLGPVTHWLYFTPLRRHVALWSDVLIWSSLLGCVLCASGLLWGVWRFSPRSRFRLKRESSHSPYVGWMKWHHYAGLGFGVVTLTWIYSGLLSMEPFHWFAPLPVPAEQRQVAAGAVPSLAPLTVERLRTAAAAIGTAFAPKELEVMQFRGEPFWFADRAPSAEDAARWMNAGLLPRAPRPRLERRYVSVTQPERGTFTTFDPAAMTEIARVAMPGVPVRDAVWLGSYDSYYYDPRSSLALPVLRVRYADAQETWLYLDPGRGAAVQRSVRISRLQRWLYHGLHSLDFPVLYFRRPLWDITTVALSLGGAVLSVTAMMPAWRRLRRLTRARVRPDGARRSGPRSSAQRDRPAGGRAVP